MKLNNQEKMIYKSILYRKIEHLNLKDDIKEKFIDNVLDEAENKFRKSFSLFLRELFNKRLTELLNNKVPALTKKEYKLICSNCNYNVSIPKEIGKILTIIKDTNNINLHFTCPNCNKRKIKL